MNDNKTIIGLLIIIAILGALLGIRMLFPEQEDYSKNYTEISLDPETVSKEASNAIADKASPYTQSVQKEKDNHNKLESEWDEYSK